MNKNELSEEIALYKPKDGDVELHIHVEDETLWLTMLQITELFGVDKSGISRHIKSIYASRELAKQSTVRTYKAVANDGKQYKTDHYNLDMILSIGYRVNSKKGTQFRIWATDVLRQHLLKGYTVNQQRIQSAKLQELESTVKLFKNVMAQKQLTGDESEGLLKVITDYTDTWLLLEKYDKDSIEEPKKSAASKYTLTHSESVKIITALKKNLLRKKQASDLFGKERKDALASVLGNIEQTFDGKNLYRTIEEKVSHLLYFIVKDHPFVDGNKRIAAFLFIVFLQRSNYLTGRDGERKFNDNALVALVLLVAQSDPKQKDLMIRLIMQFVQGK